MDEDERVWSAGRNCRDLCKCLCEGVEESVLWVGRVLGGVKWRQD